MRIVKQGKVYLLGAGPGDVNLLTIKGKSALQQADVIIYDRLANPRLLDFARPDCELIFGGKLPGKPIVTQEELNHLLVSHASEGKIVVRLKSGDPSVFGRVGEEAGTLESHRIDYDIIPGITSGIAAPLYAGIPVTHREYGTSFAIVTAHSKLKDGHLIDWKAVSGIDTVAFYMGVANLPAICENLIKEGKKASTPVILMQWGTYSRQKILEGTLETIAQKAADVQFSNPAIILVGEIVNLRAGMNWFENKPLFGRQILLARTSTGESKLAARLAEQGADVVEFPKWQRTSLAADRKIIEQLPDYQSVFFASPDCIDDFLYQIAETGLDVRQLKADFFAGSPKSIRRLHAAGFQATATASYGTLPGKLLIVGEKEPYQQVDAGSNHQFNVWWVAEKKINASYLPILQQTLQEVEPDTVLFPSSASVVPFLEGLKMAEVDAEEVLAKGKIGCLGSQTKKTLSEAGITLDYIPETATVEALLDELKK